MDYAGQGSKQGLVAVGKAGPRRVVFPLPEGPMRAVMRPGYSTPDTFFRRLIFSFLLA